MVQILLTEPEKCDGCNECIEACEKVLGKSALFLNKMDSGYHAIVCQQCIDPSCARGCFRDAIKRENGTVSIDQESCVGCKLCMLMCPIGAITYTEDGMVKCDQQCIQNPGDTPACVAACEKGSHEVTEPSIEDEFCFLPYAHNDGIKLIVALYAEPSYVLVEGFLYLPVDVPC